MKVLYLIRHAKSSWDNILLTDFERVLNERGQFDATLMGKIIAEKQPTVQHIISSSAHRAKETAERIVAQFSEPKPKIDCVSSLYDASEQAYLYVISSIANEYDVVALVAHNFTISRVASILSNGEYNSAFPTCGVLGIISEAANSWDQFSRVGGLVFYEDFPKNHKQKE